MESNKTLKRQKQKKNIRNPDRKRHCKQTNKKTGKMNKGKEKKLKKEK